MEKPLSAREEAILEKRLARASQQGWGIAIGSLAGFGLLIATLWLVVKGGDNPGPHLSLLRIYFPGYSVTVVGSFIGFIYAFVGGYAVGRTVAVIYNRLLP